MMSPKTLLMLMGLAVSSAGCELLGLEGPVEVRVLNGSSLVFDEGILYLHSDSVVFTSLDPGQATPYQETEKAYRYATTQVITASDTARIQVIDFVGEKPLGGGRYTYVLSFFEGNPRSLTLELRRDR